MEFWSLDVTLCDFRDENMLASMIDGRAGRALVLAVHAQVSVCGGTRMLHAITTCMHMHAAFARKSDF